VAVGYNTLFSFGIYAVTTVTIGIEFILARAYPDAIPQPNVAKQLPVSPGLWLEVSKR
jgi:hypothetical protein